MDEDRALSGQVEDISRTAADLMGQATDLLLAEVEDLCATNARLVGETSRLLEQFVVLMRRGRGPRSLGEAGRAGTESAVRGPRAMAGREAAAPRR